MRRERRAAALAAWQIAILVTALGCFLGPSSAVATGLRVGTRISQEMDAPLIPVTRHFRMCFRAQPDGTPVLALCAEGDRTPAAGPAPGAPGVTAPTGSPPTQAPPQGGAKSRPPGSGR